MKRTLALILSLLMLVCLFAGCTKGGDDPAATASGSGTTSTGSTSSDSGSTDASTETNETDNSITPDVYKSSMTDSGNVPYIMTISHNPQPTWQGMIVRQDWLDNAGYTGTPKTYDDWHEMLTALKDQAGVAPAYFASTSGMYFGFSSGFDAISTFIYRNHEQVEFSPITPEFKEYLELMNQWYAEGLIDHDFTTRANSLADFGTFANGDFGVIDTIYTFIDMIKLVSGNPEMEISAVSNPKRTAGDLRHFTTDADPTYVGGARATISATCAAKEVAIAYMDYFFSEEGALLANYGIEGETFEFVNGTPKLLPIITANPDGLSFIEALIGNVYLSTWTFDYDWTREVTDSLSQQALDACTVWQSDIDEDDNWDVPNMISLSVEESNIYSAIYGDINTYVVEQVIRFITGAKPMSEWDSYVEQIERIGVQTCIDIYQAACERYDARG